MALAVDLGAIILARYQGLSGDRIAFFIAYVAALALVSMLAVVLAGRFSAAAHTAMYAAAAGYISLGVLSLPTVGLGLIAAGLLQLWGVGRRRILTATSIGAIAVAVAVAVAGLVLTR